MAVIKTLKGQTVVTVVCNIIYPDPPPLPPPDPEEDTFIQHIHKMASAWRVVAFFLVVFALPVVLIALPLYARYTLYPARSLALVASDSVDLHTLASSFWCQGQRMSSNGTFSAYLLPRVPKASKKRRRTTTVSNILKISETEPEVRMVHLLKGSTVALGVCARWPGGTVIVVQGEKNFKRCHYTEDIDLDDLVSTLPDSPNHEHYSQQRRIRQRSRMTKESTRSKSVFPISDSDISSISDDDAREVFEESDSLPHSIDDVHTWTLKGEQNKPETTTIRLLEESASSQSDSGHRIRESRYKTRTPIIYPSYKKDIPKKSNPTDTDAIRHTQDDMNEIEDDYTDNSNRILRVLRSIMSRRDPDDGSDEHKKRNEEEARKISQLHSVNDTRDVTAGNSSVSSSEEFMAHCTNTIVHIDITSYIDCQSQNVSENIQWNFRVNETDDYYVIFLSDNSLEENVMKYYLELDRVLYNVSGTEDSCSNSTECTFPLQFLGSEAVVVEMAGLDTEVLTELSSYEMQAVCQPRVAVYMVFILLVPFIILLFAFQ